VDKSKGIALFEKLTAVCLLKKFYVFVVPEGWHSEHLVIVQCRFVMPALGQLPSRPTFRQFLEFSLTAVQSEICYGSKQMTEERCNARYLVSIYFTSLGHTARPFLRIFTPAFFPSLITLEQINELNDFWLPPLSSLFWDVTQRSLVVSTRRFGRI
jgi:hypothetical protein